VGHARLSPSVSARQPPVISSGMTLTALPWRMNSCCFELPAELSSSWRFGPLAAMGNQNGPTRPGRECPAAALHQPGEDAGRERFIVGDLALVEQ